MIVASFPLIKKSSIPRRWRTIVLMSWMCSNMIPVVRVCDRSFTDRTVGITTSMMSYKVWMECYITFVTFGLQGYFITYSDNMCICIIRMYRSNLLHFIPTQTDDRQLIEKQIPI